VITKEYIKDATRTESEAAAEAGELLYGDNFDIEETPVCNVAVGDPRIIHGLLGKITESAEMAEILAGHLFSGHEIDLVNLQEELGDDFWYDAILHDAAGLDPAETLRKNIEKLRHRYPKKFTEECAEKRDLAGERRILEGSAELRPSVHSL